MILKKHRFHGHNSLRVVYTKGQTFRAGPLALKILDNPRRLDYRLAVVVSKKVSKSAVRRNRMRRRLYEQVRRLEPQLTKQPDMVLTVFEDSVGTMPPADLQKTVEQLFKSAGLLNPK